uniref:Capsid protein n=1 Tax=Hibiscus chlorotic speck associated virus 1 TaxID=3143942 RepID=A0AAU7L2H8_9VIRU
MTYLDKVLEKESLRVVSGVPGSIKLRDPFEEKDAYFKQGTTQPQLNELFMAAMEMRKKESKDVNAGNSFGDVISGADDEREERVIRRGTSSQQVSNNGNVDEEGCKLYDLFKDISGQAGIAMVSEIAKIHSKWGAMGVQANNLEKLSLEIAIHCADSGSSPKTQLKGVSKFVPGRCFDDLVGCIREVCTLRSFCAFYAQYVWNIMISNNQAPSNYIKKGYKEESKFAAFDFFHGVKSRASKKPKNGIIREPSLVEIIANRTNSMVLISRTTEFKDVNASTEIEITGGRIGPTPKLMVRNFKK